MPRPRARWRRSGTRARRSAARGRAGRVLQGVASARGAPGGTGRESPCRSWAERWQISKMIGRSPAGNRHGIGRVGDLRDEALVLAQRHGEPAAQAGRAPLQERAQQRLVAGDDLSTAGRQRVSRHHWRRYPATASFTRPSAAGATDSRRRPEAEQGCDTPPGSEAMSPHRLTGAPRWRHHGAPPGRSTGARPAGSGSLRAATRPPASRDAAMTYWVRSLLPIE